MKKLVLTSVLLLFVVISVIGQTSTFRVYSELEDQTSYIKIYINGEPQDAMFYDEYEVEDLMPGKYEIIVSFNSDTIADYVKKMKIEANTNYVYKVVPKGDFGKEAGKMGRSFGRKFGTTEENDKRNLIEYYRLVRVDVIEE